MSKIESCAVATYMRVATELSHGTSLLELLPVDAFTWVHIGWNTVLYDLCSSWFTGK